tara:strand:+ start:67 stop:291 length:225 start_codon:yes stop_codon:yes gene_type:complete
MDLNFLLLNGYGMFVWPAFLFTFISCLSVYIKTKRELQQLENIYLREFKQLEAIKIEVVEEKEEAKKVFSSSAI